jgi:hypothetical protein
LFYWICTTITVGLIIFHISSYIRYKRSGSLIYINSFKVQDFLVVALWVAVGSLSIFNVIRFKSITAIDGSWLIELVFWILAVSIVIFISLQRNKITEGGIQYKNYFWVWEKIVSYEWTSKYTLKLNVKPLLFLIKPIIVIDLWKKKEQKDIVEQFIQEHISANLKNNNYL